MYWFGHNFGFVSAQSVEEPRTTKGLGSKCCRPKICFITGQPKISFTPKLNPPHRIL